MGQLQKSGQSAALRELRRRLPQLSKSQLRGNHDQIDDIMGIIGWSYNKADTRVLGRGFESTVYWVTKNEAASFAKKMPGKFDVGNPVGVHGKVFALKVDHAGASAEGASEARIQVHVNKCSPGLTPRLFWSGIYDDGKTQMQRVTLMEFVQGTPLKLYGHVSPRLLDDSLRQLKACGVKHMDLHTENIIVMKGADGQPKLMIIDYGLSKLRAPIPGHMYDPKKNSNRKYLMMTYGGEKRTQRMIGGRLRTIRK